MKSRLKEVVISFSYNTSTVEQVWVRITRDDDCYNYLYVRLPTQERIEGGGGEWETSTLLGRDEAAVAVAESPHCLKRVKPVYRVSALLETSISGGGAGRVVVVNKSLSLEGRASSSPLKPDFQSSAPSLGIWSKTTLIMFSNNR